MINGLSRLTDRRGEYVFFVKAAPLPAVIHIDEMTQCLARGIKLPFCMLTLDVGRARLGHSESLAKSRKN